MRKLRTEEKAKILLLIDPVLKDKIEEDALQNDRTRQGQLTHILEEYYRNKEEESH